MVCAISGSLAAQPPSPAFSTSQSIPGQQLQPGAATAEQTGLIPAPGNQPPAGRSSLIQVPISPTVKELKVEGQGDSVSILARDVDIRLVLGDLSDESGVNFVLAPGVTGTVNTVLRDVPLWQALDAILKVNGLVWSQQEGIIYVSRPGAAAAAGTAGEYTSRGLLGQMLEVYDLDYVSSAEVLPVVQTLLSAAGRAHPHVVDIASTRQTRERLVVEDFPDRQQVIANYIARIDLPPRQVLIEAHVLQVTLNKDQRHGVNLAGLARVAGARVEVRAQGFANGDASPGFMMGVDGNDLDGMLEMLKSNSYVRTLAAPKVMVINGQEARIQIGSKFGYFETTTTQTGTFQNVNFLDIGVVLQVTPTITQDGQVMLSVQPKVSGGRVNPDTGLPEEETTEAQTTVILPDGKGMIIGGLIKEQDEHSRSWIPWIGEQPIIGKLFRRSNDDKQRVEVVIALTPHVVPYNSCIADRESRTFIQTTDTHGIISGGIGPYTPANEMVQVRPEVINPFHHRETGFDLPRTDFHDAIMEDAKLNSGSVSTTGQPPYSTAPASQTQQAELAFPQVPKVPSPQFQPR